MADPQFLGDVLAAEPLLLTPEEAAKVLHVGRTTFYALMKAGDVHPVHIGRSCRISRAELERFVRRLEVPPPSGLSRPRRQRRTDTNQNGLFEFRSDLVDRGPDLWTFAPRVGTHRDTPRSQKPARQRSHP